MCHHWLEQLSLPTHRHCNVVPLGFCLFVLPDLWKCFDQHRLQNTLYLLCVSNFIISPLRARVWVSEWVRDSFQFWITSSCRHIGEKKSFAFTGWNYDSPSACTTVHVQASEEYTLSEHFQHWPVLLTTDHYFSVFSAWTSTFVTSAFHPHQHHRDGGLKQHLWIPHPHRWTEPGRFSSAVQ